MAIDTLRRFFLPCFTPSTNHKQPTTTPSKKQRLSTSLRHTTTTTKTASPSSSTSSSSAATTISTTAPPRPSKSMVIGTIFGNRRGHVWFCVQHDRLTPKPSLLLELPLSTNNLVREMRNGLVRIALECCTSSDNPAFSNCPLRSVPLWTAFCNGRKNGFATRRRAGDRVRTILQTMQCVTVGAGVIPSGFGSGSEELMYMRANFEHVVGNADSESFHLINPDESTGQELSVFLLRSRLGVNR
ncbi:protein MIZU-KUSSEI 1 [Cicer arietinum]|uniref:Protein MIZU-KUSSEI 1 n=1 Tax=Cicer arietinum TaxID=3827 RepID=A0A1S2Z6J3_CICAR|nr:protein MIZU-KUSSEI 1 [Cicer arietinum]